jgi:hypothetical protein
MAFVQIFIRGCAKQLKHKHRKPAPQNCDDVYNLIEARRRGWSGS